MAVWPPKNWMNGYELMKLYMTVEREIFIW